MPCKINGEIVVFNKSDKTKKMINFGYHDERSSYHRLCFFGISSFYLIRTLCNKQ